MGKAIEVAYQAVKAFKALKKFNKIKIQFATNAFITGQAKYWRRVERYLPGLDLSFLYEDDSESHKVQAEVRAMEIMALLLMFQSMMPPKPKLLHL